VDRDAHDGGAPPPPPPPPLEALSDDDGALRRLIERHVVGEASPEEEALLAHWIAADPGRRALVDVLRAEWGAIPAAHDVDLGWTRLAHRMRRARAATDRNARLTTPRSAPRFAERLAPRRSPFGAIIAASAAILLFALALRFTRTSAPSAASPAAPTVYATTAGQRAELHLSDGTHVFLAPASRMRVAADFGTQRRDVYVEGEAYFEVVHDSTRPFTVFAGNASTQDIGTSFAVRSYPDDHAVRVTVLEGTVAMSGAGLLRAGDVGRLTAQGAASVRHNADVDALLGWIHGDLVFEDAPLAQVLRDLHRWYGTDAAPADSVVAALPFTGSLRGVSPQEAIDVVAATLGLRVRRVSAGLDSLPRLVLEKRRH
jgi:transmembrane sensor